MPDKVEFCDECRWRFDYTDAPALFKQGFIRCVPCGAKCCSRECLHDHRIYCQVVRAKITGG